MYACMYIHEYIYIYTNIPCVCVVVPAVRKCLLHRLVVKAHEGLVQDLENGQTTSGPDPQSVAAQKDHVESATAH